MPLFFIFLILSSSGHKLKVGISLTFCFNPISLIDFHSLCMYVIGDTGNFFVIISIDFQILIAYSSNSSWPNALKTIPDAFGKAKQYDT